MTAFRRCSGVASLILLLASTAFGQADAPTTISVAGGAQGASQVVPVGQGQFGLRVPLKPNAENVLSLTATDTDGRKATVNDIRVAQISLTEIVRAQVTAQRLTTQEVRQLVAEGTINLADPTNYNVSRFVIALVVGGQQVRVEVPVFREKNADFGEGEPVSIGCAAPGKGLSMSDRAISVPCGPDSGGSSAPQPIQIIPFEIVIPGVPGEPVVPGVIIIEGRIKTLKEFFKVNLLLMNVSSLFTLTDLTATLEVPPGALTPVVPAGGSISLADLAPNSEGTGQFIVRGDEKGVHTITAHFGGKIIGSFLPEPVPFSGSASTDLEVKGPPKMDVLVSHPSYVIAEEPYELRVEIINTDPELDALYTTLEIDVGGDAELIDETTGLGAEGPSVRSVGDILRGSRIVQVYKVLPHVTGPITSCVGAASENLTLSVGFVGGPGPGCAIGTLPSDRVAADGRPTVTVVPAHNTNDVPVDPAVVAIFSTLMIEQTITTGYPQATFNVLDKDDNVVAGVLTFTELFEATAAIFRPAVPFATDSEYTIVVRPDIFDLSGNALSSGMVARFTTEGGVPVPDTTDPTVVLSIEPPLNAAAIQRGQLTPVIADSSDNEAVLRVDLYLDGNLIDAKHPNSPVRFLVETADLVPGTAYELTAVAFDAAGNLGQTSLTLQIAPDAVPPAISLNVPPAIGRGRVLHVEAEAVDDVRVARVSLYLDGGIVPVAEGLIAPFAFDVETAALSGGFHQLRAEAIDGAGNEAEASMAFEVTLDTLPPTILVAAPIAGATIAPGSSLAVAALVIDDSAVASVAYFIDAEGVPRSTDPSGAIIGTLGLAEGPHVVRFAAADTSGNVAEVIVPFAIVAGAGDVTAPTAPVLALLSTAPPTGGVITVYGAAGAVEAGARVEVLNTTTSGLGQVVASGTGAFELVVEASGGQTLRLVAIDAAGNRSPGTDLTLAVAPTLTSIDVSPAAVLLDRTQNSQQLVVTGTFSDASQQPVTSGLIFTSSAPTIVSATATGLLLPGQNGSATMTVSTTTPGVTPVGVPVTVNFTSVTGLVPTPNPLVIDGLGRSQRITVAAQFSDSTTGPFGGVVHFATGNANVAIVDPTGQVTSTGIGSTNVSIASQGLPPQAVLVVVNAVQPTGLVVSPNSVALTTLGQTQALSVRFTFSDGTEGPGPFPATFTSRAANVASVSPEGVISAEGEGNTFVDVDAAGFAVAVSVSVTVPSTLPPPEIWSLGRPIAGEGDTLAIIGRNFSGIAGLNFVTINGQQAEVQGASFDRLIAVVPHGATSGLVTVRVAGQDSNSVDVIVYARRAAAVLANGPFNAPGTPLADLGSAAVVIQPGDDLVVSGDPNLIVGSQWSSLPGPSVVGTLVVTIDGQETVVSNSSVPVDLTSLLGPVTEPRLVTVAARIEEAGGQLSSQGVAIITGPPGTGPFIGQRFSTGDTIDQQTEVRFQVSAPDGTKFAATAVDWYRVSDGGCCNGSVGGSIVGGVLTPNDNSFRTFVAQNGEVAVTYSDVGVFADFGAPRTAVIALVPADASGNRTTHLPLAEARILIGALDSASILPQQPSVVADGADHPITVDVNSVRDNYGNRILDGSRFAVTAANWYRRSDGGCCNGSAGGSVSGGVPTPNDGSFRTITLAGGVAQFTYSPLGLSFSSGQEATAMLVATTANAAANRLNARPFAEGSVALSSLSVEDAIITAVPAALSATSSDNRSVITLSGLTDASGRPIPDGSRVAVTAVNWYRVSDGGCCNGSFGGSIVGGDPVPNDGNFRSFQSIGGAVTFTYSNAGLVLNREATAETVISVLPAATNGNRIGTRPFADVRITQAGLTSATIVASPSSTLADGTQRPVAVAITNIRDALGNIVPDGTRVALTAINWYRRSDGGCCNGSAGGTFLDGVVATNDPNFFVFTVSGARIDATFSAETIPPLGVTDTRSSVIAAVAASEANSRLLQTPFAEGVIAISSIATGTAVANPVSLLADKQDRQSVITISGLTDAQGRPVPDGTKIAVTAANWYRLADGGFPNGSAGGTMIGGVPTPNDSSFRTYTVANGEVTVTYSSSGLFVDTGATAPAVVSILPATGAGHRVGTRPLAIASVLLVGMDTGTVVAPATTPPGSSVAVTLTNMRDTAGNLLPDGTKVAVTAANWYDRSGACCNGSAGGTVLGGVATPNDGSFRTFVVSGGEVSFTFTAPITPNVTSVLSVLSADGAGNRNSLRPFATFSIRAQ